MWCNIPGSLVAGRFHSVGNSGGCSPPWVCGFNFFGIICQHLDFSSLAGTGWTLDLSKPRTTLWSTMINSISEFMCVGSYVKKAIIRTFLFCLFLSLYFFFLCIFLSLYFFLFLLSLDFCLFSPVCPKGESQDFLVIIIILEDLGHRPDCRCKCILSFSQPGNWITGQVQTFFCTCFVSLFVCFVLLHLWRLAELFDMSRAQTMFTFSPPRT